MTIIEVKGCWNEGLFTAMRTQLRDRYLKNNPDASGIYCVGWFQCAAWDRADTRKRVRSRSNMDDVAQKLAQQAKRLSASSRISAVMLDVRLPDADEKSSKEPKRQAPLRTRRRASKRSPATKRRSRK